MRSAHKTLQRLTHKSIVRIYRSADVPLLAATDTLLGTRSGLATKKLMERAYRVFVDIR